MQLSLFTINELDDEKKEGIIISKSVLSPLESESKLGSLEFRENQITFSKYVLAIQAFHKCSFFDAREMFFEHRDNQNPIKIDFDYFF